MASERSSSSVGTAPGKVILLGEHAVVYGRTAIAAAIDRHVRVAVWLGGGRAAGEIGSAGDGDAATVVLSRPGEADPSAHSVRLREAVTRAGELLDVETGDLTVEVSSDLPTAVGLGSSAALSVALVRCLYGLAGRAPDAAAVCAAAFELERLFHGFPSGIDNTVATYGGLLAFARERAPRPLVGPRAIPLVIAIGRAPRQTQTAVRALRTRWESDRTTYDRWFDEIADLGAAAEVAISMADWPALGGLFDRNHALLQRLEVSTPELDAMVTLARQRGARGAKLTGGGGGGAIICLHDADRRQLIDAFQTAGWRAFATDIHPSERGSHARTDHSYSPIAAART